MKPLRQKRKRVRTRHRRNMPGAEQRVHARFPAQQRDERVWHGLVRRENRKILGVRRNRRLQKRGGVRRGRFESDAVPNDLAKRICTRKIERVHRRNAEANVRAARAKAREALVSAGHAQHVPKAKERHVWHLCQRECQRNVRLIGHADRAARPRNEAYLLGQQLPDSVAADGVRMRSADLHDGGWRQVLARLTDLLR